MKELIEKIDMSISNMNDKNDLASYFDDRYTSITDEMHKVAKDGAEKSMGIHFKEDEEGGAHISIRIDKNLSKDLGFDSIIVYNYKGHEDFGWIDSNYMFMVNENTKTLMIDIYDCEFMTYGEVYEKILQELANFKRDGKEFLEDKAKENET